MCLYITISLHVQCSTLEDQNPSMSGQHTSAHSATVDSDREAYQERMKKLREQMRRTELEKKRIAEQVLLL